MAALEIITLDCKNDLNEGPTSQVAMKKVSAIIGPPLSTLLRRDLEETKCRSSVILWMKTTNPETGEVYPYMFPVEPAAPVNPMRCQICAQDLKLTKFATLYNTGNASQKPMHPFMTA